MKKSRGLGDTVEKITRATGVHSLTSWMDKRGVLGKKGCGCSKRKNALNKAFPYKR
tara:strand:- start:801 stop:968 length:168 start_codon:yes stop_codon:yes gene_type:complete